MGEGHLPVLVDEVLTLLAVGSGSSVADCTVGGGGHAERLL
jgi:16S rRNA C1402 N4-methylase RsmH